SGVNLRGLGTNQTLILLDGRRLPLRSSGAGSTSQADVNGIPMRMIERIEVLPSTASGIYGGGATGGVINIITRKDYAGVDVAATYLNALDTDAASRRLDINGSFQLEGGKTMLTINGSWENGTTLLNRDRDFVQRARALLLANNPAALYGASTPAYGYLTNIRSLNGSNLVLKKGNQPLNSPITFVPAGYGGPATDQGQALLANAGKYSLDPPDSVAVGSRLALLSVPVRESYGLGLRRRFSTQVEAYLDASRFVNRGEYDTLSINNRATLPANAPNNPFTVPILVNFPITNLQALATGESISDRIAGGVSVRLPAEWSAGLDYVWSQANTGAASPNALLGDPDGSGPAVEFGAAVTSGALDVLKDLNAMPLNYDPYRMPRPYSDNSFKVTTDELSLRGSGPVFRLPAGNVVVSSLVQAREEKIGGSVTYLPSSTNPAGSFPWFPGVSQRSRAYYAEARAPILGSTGRTLLRELEMQLSVRRDESTAHTRTEVNAITLPSADSPLPTVTYQDRDFSATKMTAGLKYTPVRDLSLRASVGTGFLPPTFLQLGSAQTNVGTLTVIDPKRGNVQRSYTGVSYLQGGSADLQPEESESFSAGLIFTPRQLSNFRLSIDYTRVRKTNEIATLFGQQAFDLEDAYPNRVVRAPLTAQDSALGYTGGVVTQLSQRSLNISGKKLASWDVQADYTWRSASLGEFQLSVMATYQPQLAAQTISSVPYVETAGYADSIKFRCFPGLTWTRGRWSVGWNTQYYGSYYVFRGNATAASRATSTLNQGSATIPSQTYHDVMLRYSWGASQEGWRKLLADTQLTLGIQNVFNTSPPILATTVPAGSISYSQVGDPRLARYTLSLRRHF
ncbi:MAG: TonB-dependent receptor, partial [Opitutaceae bacterium]|nr:TonB-dependent receptor [Opitutaceae bacterium]